ncbi:hypothetical protein N180_03055 [Pedobacter antarcticus 4BY]|uniref:Uncharacterized protein n=2 Tax=Pedobacter antarcticus TaxID=34086 RepID=A0A081PKL8_9SPHI|nr:hypothetical protein [Pedobacter antarcticus]KEQ31241.1 hypothetical protein N180_03055 [Pedobacter antarcticus 4BY]
MREIITKGGMTMGRLAITRTIIPLDYDRTAAGYNAWVIGIRNELHLPDKAFDIHSIIPETNKVLKFHKTLNK